MLCKLNIKNHRDINILDERSDFFLEMYNYFDDI